MFNFDAQLKVGEQGEEFFLKCYRELNAMKSNNKGFDLIVNEGETVELKTDTYSMDESANFFMEKFGNTKNIPKSLGGPWRAEKDKINHFVYFFVKNLTFFWFEPKILCRFLNKNIEKKNARYIKNEGWTALGYIVPREKVVHLCQHVDVFDKNGRKVS